MQTAAVSAIEAHDAWFQAQVLATLEDTRTTIPHEEIEAFLAEREALACDRY